MRMLTSFTSRILFCGALIVGLSGERALPDSTLITDFESSSGWRSGHAEKATIALEGADGQNGRAIRVRYDVTRDHWVEIGRDLTFEWRRVGSFHFYLRGDANGSVFELKLKDADGSYYGLKMPITGISPDQWTKITVPFRDCHYLWGGDSKLDTVSSIWFAVSRGLARKGYVDIDDFSYSPKEIGDPVVEIHASQIGYDPWDDKSFVVRVFDAPAESRLTGSFRVVTLEGRAKVHEGRLDEFAYPKWSGRFLTGNFSAVRKEGTYQIEVEVRDEAQPDAKAWTASSYPFAVETDVIARYTAPIQYYYARFMRCGIICHKDDPVPGGYHDTQMDISKRMWSIPHFILGLARYATTGAFRFDSDTDKVDDVTDELRFGLKFIADMPEPDGTVSWGGIEADFKKFMTYEEFIARLGPLRREEDTIPRVKYTEKNFHGTCFNTVALLEGAAAVRPVDAALADRAEGVARTAWKWIDAQPLGPAHDYGAYLYAALALHHRFPDGGYLHRLDSVLPVLLDLQSLDPALTENGAVGNFFYAAAERDFHFQYKFVSFNIAIHHALIQLEETLPKSNPLWNRIHYANTVFAKSYLPRMSSLTPYGQIAHGLEPDSDRVFHPKQFSGKAGERAAASFHGLNCDHFGYAYVAMKYAQLTGDVDLERFADEQIQWSLGKNPLGYCMMAGAGSKNPVHMSAFFGKGPILGEIPNGIVSGNEQDEEPEWWGEGPSSGEDWLPHNSYYLSLISELGRPAEIHLDLKRGSEPLRGRGMVRVEREDGMKLPEVHLRDGKAVLSLSSQASHTIRVFDLAANMIYERVIRPVSGQRVVLDVDLDRDGNLEWVVPPDADSKRDVTLTLTIGNRSSKQIEIRPAVSIIGGDIAGALPDKWTVPAKSRMNQRVTVRARGGQPVLVRVEDRSDPRLSADAYWVPRRSSDAVTVEAGKVIDDFSKFADWVVENEQGATITAKTENDAMRVDYSFGAGKWAQVKKSAPMDISPYGVITFRMRGEGPANRLELKLEDADGVNIGLAFDAATASGEWRDFEIPLKELKYWWGGDGTFDWKKLKFLYFAVGKTMDGKGAIWLDDVKLSKAKVTPKDAPAPQKDFEYVKGDESVANRAAKWISSMQEKSGFILSYEGDNRPFAWTYDQGLCLIVLAHADRPAAVRLLEALRKLQKPEGYWNDGIMLDTGQSIDLPESDKTKWLRSDVPGVHYEFDNRWIGSVAWVVHGIQRYTRITGDDRYSDMMMRGAKWLASQQRPDGSLHDVMEGNMTSWRCLKNAGLNDAADRLRTYLLTKIWKDDEGRYLVAPDNTQIYLDVQTWGASFSVDAGVPQNALRSLAFAKKNLACKTFDRRTRGFDTTGPYTVWNEGTLQYIVAGGEGASEYLQDMNKQQREDGALQHSHEDHTQGGAWHTVMYGVCPTAWLYFANMGTEPFPRE